MFKDGRLFCQDNRLLPSITVKDRLLPSLLPSITVYYRLYYRLLPSITVYYRLLPSITVYYRLLPSWVKARPSAWPRARPGSRPGWAGMGDPGQNSLFLKRLDSSRSCPKLPPPIVLIKNVGEE